VTRQNIGSAKTRSTEVRAKNPAWAKKTVDIGKNYRVVNNARFAARTKVVTRFYSQAQYRFYYSGYYKHGFYGGFFYPVRSARIDAYFAYPMVEWLFASDYDSDYWNDYYDRQWENGDSSAPVVQFPYAGIFYPTDTIRDLAVEVSAMSAALQAQFRVAMISFVGQLQQQISDQLTAPITLDQYEVVINHYQNLGNQAIVVEGFVDKGGAQYAFKGLLDLVDPSQTTVFVPTAQDPDASDIAKLDAMNARIVRMGGDPYTADQEPVSAKSLDQPVNSDLTLENL
jgi:hypothetical protein